MNSSSKSTMKKKCCSEACNRFVESRQYPLAWIGFKKEGSFDILPFVQCGERADYLAAVNITRDDSPFGSGPTGIAVKTGKPDVIQDMVHDLRYGPWKETALKHGFKASAAFPLIIQDKVIGVLTHLFGVCGSLQQRRSQFARGTGGRFISRHRENPASRSTASNWKKP
jgi:hypothetical protein